MAKKRQTINVVKKMLFFCFYYSRFFDLTLSLLKIVRREHPCIILLYHRVVEDGSKYLRKGPGVQQHVRHLRREIAYLKRSFQILGMDEVVNQLRSGKGFRKPSIAITFDDGYLDNYALAYPFLKKHAVPATIYLTTGLIGTTGRTWTDQVELALLETRKHYFCLPELFMDERVPIRSKEEKEQANRKVTEALKQKPDGERRDLMGRLFETLGIDGKSGRTRDDRIMLNWDEVREMTENGISIGSHSHTHPILSRMPLHEAKEEISNSKRVAEKNLNMTVKHFSFPNGRKEDFSEDLRDYCREIGFESICSVIYGANGAPEANVFGLKRINAIDPVPLMAGELVRLFWKSPAVPQDPRGQRARPGSGEKK